MKKSLTILSRIFGLGVVVLLIVKAPVYFQEWVFDRPLGERSGEEHLFYIQEQQGEVKVKYSEHLLWFEIKPEEKLRNGDLVYVEDNGSIGLRHFRKGIALGRILVKGEILFRLESDGDDLVLFFFAGDASRIVKVEGSVRSQGSVSGEMPKTPVSEQKPKEDEKMASSKAPEAPPKKEMKPVEMTPQQLSEFKKIQKVDRQIILNPQNECVVVYKSGTPQRISSSLYEFSKKFEGSTLTVLHEGKSEVAVYEDGVDFKGWGLYSWIIKHQDQKIEGSFRVVDFGSFEPQLRNNFVCLEFR